MAEKKVAKKKKPSLIKKGETKVKRPSPKLVTIDDDIRR